MPGLARLRESPQAPGKTVDAEATIELGGQGVRPRLVVNCGMKRADLADALRVVHERQAALLERWGAIHG